MQKKRIGFAAIPVAALAIGASSAADAASVTIDAMKDNTLYQDVIGNISNGQGPHLYSGNNGGGRIRRALIMFDVASFVPSEAVITSVVLDFNVSNASVLGGPQNHTLHRMLADWGEGKSDAGSPGGSGSAADSGDATWTHAFFDTVEWATDGGDFDGTSSADTVIDNVGAYSFSSAGMVADVSSWLSSGDNFGWMIRGNENDDFTAKRIDSRNNSDPSVRPTLTVEFELIPAPGALALLGAAGLVGRSRRRRG